MDLSDKRSLSSKSLEFLSNISSICTSPHISSAICLLFFQSTLVLKCSGLVMILKVSSSSANNESSELNQIAKDLKKLEK